MRRVAMALLVFGSLELGAACRRRPASRPVTAPAATPACPSPEALARLVAAPGRQFRTDCVVYAPGFFWLGAALAYDPDGANPRLSLIYGGQPPGVYDLDAAPPEALTRLIKAHPDLRVNIRKPSRDSRLVRIGVFGQHGSPDHPEADEVVLVLRLVAHAPPEILWIGPGDQVRTDRSACIVERTVDFEMPFGERLEMTTVQRAHPAAGGKQLCAAGPSTQQTVEFKAQSLKPSRKVELAGAK
jgi:hypothetical protein